MPLSSLVVIVCRGKEWVIEPLQFPYIIYVYDLHDWKLKLICLFISWFWCSHHITNISRCIISFLSWKICTMLMFPSCYEQVLGDSIFHLKLLYTELQGTVSKKGGTHDWQTGNVQVDFPLLCYTKLTKTYFMVKWWISYIIHGDCFLSGILVIK